jgi:peptide/nickel transport system substrate-binding protein
MVPRKLALLILVACSACRYWSAEHDGVSRASSGDQIVPSVLDPWALGKLPELSGAELPRRGGEIVVRIGTEPPSLNTIVDSDAVAALLTEHRIYESLVGIDPYDHPTYRHRPELAERWETSEDRLTYTFWLRRSAKWHDGKPFTARDVLATFSKVQDADTKAVNIRAYTQDIESIRALDDYTVVFHFKRPYFLVMDGIFADVPIQPAHLIEHLSGTQYNDSATNSINRRPIGTGPFRFGAWVSNQEITLQRNEEYWGRAPYLRQVVFRIVKENAIVMELAAREELDVVTRIRPEQWAKMDRAQLGSHYHRSLYYGANYAWIGYNQARSMFEDARVRRAMALLIDRKGILKGLLHGIGRETTCHFYFESAACDPSLEPLPYDPVQASRLLDAAGWRLSADGTRRKNAQKFSFSFMIPVGSDDSARMATLAKESMARVGIDMRLQRVEWSAFVKRLREHDFDACTLMWSSAPRSDPTQVWHSASIQGGSNYVGFRSARADALIETARTEFDTEKRDAIYREFGRLLYDEQPYTWLFVKPELSLVHRRIHGARVSILGFRYEDLWVDAARGGEKGPE